MNWRFFSKDSVPSVPSDPPELGRIGEEIAAAYLRKRGLELLARNYRAGKSELDLVLYDRRRKFLRVVEVKSRLSSGREAAYDSLTEGKLEALRRGAAAFLREQGGRCRPQELFFDLVIVLFSPDGAYTVEYVPGIEM